ncbi:MAG TPA: 2OG-Fe(II) oxygenase, partial [Blastocatellia bacterium]|nr:2OG-Fe(II) oxygenase [Blastocatellia bacterium]
MSAANSRSETADITSRIDSLDWASLESQLDEQGFVRTGEPVLTRDECRELTGLYYDENRFRSRIEMERYRFGAGEYKYFGRPLPDPIESLRVAVYPHLVDTANRWATSLGKKERYPSGLASFLATCHNRGQVRPTPLILRYEAGDYNCLHQDLYGDIAFPLQMTCILSAPGQDFTGGEFLLVEQRPRA